MTKPTARGMPDAGNGVFRVAAGDTPSHLDTSIGSLHIVLKRRHHSLAVRRRIIAIHRLLGMALASKGSIQLY